MKLEAAITDNKITMCVYEDGSTLPHYDQTSVSLQEVFLLCNEIIKLLNKANNGGGRSAGISAELKKAGQCLYDQLLTESAKKKFRASKAVNLEVYIDEGLVAVPWELLFDGAQFLCLRFNMGRKVKTRQPSRSSGDRVSGFPIKMLILADPTNDLAMARQEAGVIEKQLDGMRKTIAVAKKVTNIDPVYVKKNLRDYDIVHYAGHADHDPVNPSQSGWTLTGGRLTAEDIARMGDTAPLPSLIFSNACRSAETGQWVGDDFETQVFGLANAFLCAGVRHYIGTSWKIPDDISLAFAKEFYAQLAQSKSVGEAIRLARLQIIKDQGEDSIVWASYVLYGDPANLLLCGFKRSAFLVPVKVLIKQMFFVFIVLVGMAAGILGLIKVFGGSDADKQALVDYYSKDGGLVNKGKSLDFVKAEQSLRKALRICNSMKACDKGNIEDGLSDLQSIKALDMSAKTQDFDMRIKIITDVARRKMKRSFDLGQGEDGSLAERMQKEAIGNFKNIVTLLDGRNDLKDEQRNILEEALFSLVMLYVPSDYERAQLYYEKFSLCALSIKAADREGYYSRLENRFYYFLEKAGYESSCRGIIEKRHVDIPEKGTHSFETLIEEGWIERLSDTTGRLKAPPDEKFWSRLQALGHGHSAWMKAAFQASCRKGGALFFRIVFDHLTFLSMKVDLKEVMKKADKINAAEEAEAQEVQRIKNSNNIVPVEEYARILEESKREALIKYPDLNDETTPIAKLYLQVLDEHPEYLQISNGPILAMQEMEKRLERQERK
ncbi:MAG: CHAT domain-containing protein [Candidatus Omnitrophica bacterium]|nr:CHAT domain-containing protein [Candidatus Omnitrophota bacterium]